MARAVAFSDGSRKIAFVSIDVVGLFHGNVENIRKKLDGFQYVLVSSTHNHEGPDTLGLWGPNHLSSGVDPVYLKSIEDGAAKAIRLAEKNLAPAASDAADHVFITGASNHAVDPLCVPPAARPRLIKSIS